LPSQLFEHKVQTAIYTLSLKTKFCLIVGSEIRERRNKLGKIKLKFKGKERKKERKKGEKQERNKRKNKQRRSYFLSSYANHRNNFTV
jgi:hypothetical protein